MACGATASRADRVRTERQSAAAGGRRTHPSSPAQSELRRDPVSETLRTLTPKLGVAAIRDAWTHRLRSKPPAIQSADLLLRLFAWRLQVEAYGGLDEATTLRLNQISRSQVDQTSSSVPAIASLETGTVLIREWRDVEHRVLVLDGGFEHQGKRYKTLSEVARAITGTRWSGPRFFGIEQTERARSSEASGDSGP